MSDKNPVVVVPLAKLKPLKGYGPTPKDIDIKEVQSMAMYMCTVEETAAAFDLTERQFYRRMVQAPEIRAAFVRGRQEGRRGIKRKQYLRAVNDGDVQMLKWIGQNNLGQSSRHTRIIENLNPREMKDALDIDFDEIMEEIERDVGEDASSDNEGGDDDPGVGT